MLVSSFIFSLKITEWLGKTTKRKTKKTYNAACGRATGIKKITKCRWTPFWPQLATCIHRTKRECLRSPSFLLDLSGCPGPWTVVDFLASGLIRIASCAFLYLVIRFAEVDVRRRIHLIEPCCTPSAFMYRRPTYMVYRNVRWTTLSAVTGIQNTKKKKCATVSWTLGVRHPLLSIYKWRHDKDWIFVIRCPKSHHSQLLKSFSVQSTTVWA